MNDTTLLENSFHAIARAQKSMEQEGVSSTLIGGHASLLWGGTRLTKDMDLAIITGDSLDALIALRRAFGRENVSEATGEPGDPFQSVINLDIEECLPIQVLNFNYRVDGLAQLVKGAITNTTSKRIAEVDIKVCSMEHLIALKMQAGGPTDMTDIQDHLSSGHVNMQRLRSICEEAGLPELFERFFSEEE